MKVFMKLSLSHVKVSLGYVKFSLSTLKVSLCKFESFIVNTKVSYDT